MRPASRSTSICFMTPNRLRCGKAPTISVVVREPCRKRSRIDRLVPSDKAFHTPSSSSSGTLFPLPARVRGTVLGGAVQEVLPAGGHTLPVRRVDKADRAVPEVHMRSSGALFQLHFKVIHGG